MRVISGKFKGRKFNPPADNWPTRPTTDFAREGLFNILTNRLDFENLKALDLFGGAGSHTLELASRGCNEVIYVDNHMPCVRFIEKIAEDWGCADSLKCMHMDVALFLRSKGGKFDYIFAGPPYPLKWLDEIPDRLFSSDLLAAEGLFVLEHNPNHDFQEHRNFKEMRSYGKTLFSFFEN